eukprot:11203296-Lingulodinium_polyedra.AAC.1
MCELILSKNRLIPDQTWLQTYRSVVQRTLHLFNAAQCDARAGAPYAHHDIVRVRRARRRTAPFA